MERVTYDANGNIKAYTRHRETNPDGVAMDDLTYQYERAAGGQLTSNRLRYVHDAVTSTYTEDIESQTMLSLAQVLADHNSSQGSDNFGYDAMGNLTRDNREVFMSFPHSC